jgi:tripartite-type tricarboxylate transporter receptor subunit TctC
VARVVAKHGEKYAGKPIIVVNKPGGGGSRGFASLAAAKPDGYTIGNFSASGLMQPYLMKGVTYHYQKNFKVICQSAYMAVGLYVKKGSPYDLPLKELVQKIKEKPNTIKVGIGGTWSTEDFVRALFEDEAGLKCIRVPFTGGGTESIPALLGGHTDINFGGSPHWAPLYKGGKVNVLAISSDQRDFRFPDIPTFKENGYDINLQNSYWIVAPAKTSDVIIRYLAEAFKKAFAEQGYKEGVDHLGVTGVWTGTEDSWKDMHKMDRLIQGVVKKYDLKPQ